MLLFFFSQWPLKMEEDLNILKVKSRTSPCLNWRTKSEDRGGVGMVSTSARNAGGPWFDSRSRNDRFLYANNFIINDSHKKHLILKLLKLTKNNVRNNNKNRLVQDFSLSAYKCSYSGFFSRATNV